MKSDRVIMLSTLALLLGQALAPKCAAAAAPAVPMPEMVVVATTHERDVAGVPFEVDTIDGFDTQLRLQARTLPEALREVPGVLLQKTGHGMTSPFLRGVTGQRVVIVADGVRLNTSFLREGPNQYWNLLDPYLYEDLEVLMGPASVLYGSDAIGGVVLASSSPLLRGQANGGMQWQGGEVLGRYSSAEDSFSEHLRGNAAVDDRWSFRVGLTRQDFGELETGDSESNPNTDYRQWGGSLRARYWFSDSQTVTLGLEGFDQDDVNRVHRTVDHVDFHGTSSLGGTSDLARLYDHDRQAGWVRLQGTEGTGLIEEYDAQLYIQNFREQFRRIRGDGREREQETDIVTTGMTLRLSTPRHACGRWSAGLDFAHDEVNSQGLDRAADGTATSRIQGQVADDADYDLLGVYLQNELPIGPRWEVISGVRYTYASLRAGQVNLGNGEGSVTGDWDAVVGSLRVLFRALPGDQLDLFTGVSQGFRAPNLSDATRDGEFGGGQEAPTADLDPEYFTTFELGCRSTGTWGQVGITGYHTEIRDRIGRLQNPTPTKRNLDEGRIHGVEARATLRLHPAWTLSSSVAWQEGREDNYANRDLRFPGATRPMSRMLPLTAQAALRWTPEHAAWWLEFAVEAADDQDKLTEDEEADNRFPPGGTPGYAVCHLRGGIELRTGLDLALAVENLGDTAYRIHGSGINEPGRNLVATVRWRF